MHNCVEIHTSHLQQAATFVFLSSFVSANRNEKLPLFELSRQFILPLDVSPVLEIDCYARLGSILKTTDIISLSKC